MPIVFEESFSADTNIALWKIEESAAELESQLQLKSHELAVLRSLIGEKRNLQWLATRVLLRKMLNTHDYIDLRTEENGKPYLENNSHHISLSHSFGYAAVIISSSKRVGIDIECIKPKIENIAHKFLCSDELAFIGHQDRIERLYVGWCAKEALYKLNGERETSFKDNIYLHPFCYQGAGSLKAEIRKNQYQQKFTVHYKAMDGYMLGYVSEERQ